MREIKFKLYFDNKFVGYEKWTERGEIYAYLMWMYSQDDIAWEFQPKYAHNIKVQFTGLHDKNGKEIYEGDVVKHNDKNWEVAYVGESLGVQRAAFMLDTWNEMGFHTFKGMPENDIEVIGNIYESPELIK